MPPDIRSLRDAANKAAAAGKFKKAVEFYLELERADPGDAAWPKRTAEMYRRLGKDREGIEAYERCVARYAEAGFLAQAIAMCKMILQLDPTHSQAAVAMADMNEKLRGHTSARATTNAPIDLGLDASLAELAAAPASAPVAAPLPLAPPPAASVPPAVPVPPPRMARDSGFDIDIDSSPLEEELDADEIVELDDEALELVEDDNEEQFAIAVGSNSDDVAIAPPAEEGEEDIDQQATNLFSSFGQAERPGNSIPPPDSNVPLSIFKLGQGKYNDPPPAAFPEPDLAIEVSEPEVVPAAAPQDSLLGLATEILRRVPVFAELSPEHMGLLVNAIELINMPEGESIDLEQQRGRLFVISDGSLEYSESMLGLDLRGAGDYFGEAGALMGCEDYAKATALSDCEIIAIERDAFHALLAANSEIAQRLVDETRERRTARLLAHHELFAPFSSDDKESLLARFEFRRLTPGDIIVEQGAASKALLVLLTGNAHVMVDGDVKLRMGPGDIVGETGMLPGETATTTEVAISRAWALALSDRSFRELMMTHPHVLEVVGNVVERRQNQIDKLR